MKKKLLLIMMLGLILSFTLNSVVMAKTNSEKLLKQAPSKQEYPEAGGIYLTEKKIADHTLDKTKIRYRKVIKVFNKRGVEDYGEFKIHFNKSNEDIKIIEAKTIKPDSSVVKPKKDAINEITTPEAANVSMYSDARIKVISMPGVKPGSIVVCEYVKTKDEYAIEDEFWNYDLFQSTDPIKNKKLVIKIPVNKEINYKVRNGNLKPKIEKKDDAKIYTWQQSDIPGITKENNMPSLINLAPLVQISTLDNWSQVSSWYQGLIEKQYKVNKELKNKIKELTQGNETKEEKVKSLYNYVTSRIRYIGLQFGESGYKPYSAVETFKNKYGVCKEKATLLIAMLREIGVKAEPVLIRRGSGAVDLDIVSPILFNHMIVYLPDQDKYLDPTSKGTAYGVLPGDQNKNVLLPESDILSKTPISPANSNLAFLKQQVDLKQNGKANIVYQEEKSGVYGYAYRKGYQKYTPRQQKRIVKQGISKGFSNAQATGIQFAGIKDLNQNFSLKISNLQVKSYAKRMGNLLSFKPLRYPIKLSQLVAAEERSYPFHLGFKRKDHRKIEIDIPSNYQVNYLPEDISFQNEVGSLEATYKQQNNKVVLDFNLIVDQYQLEVSEYQAARELLNQAEGVAQNQILLKRQ
ncbi:DUF3857 domain-containing protein [Sporohalobacter salinus]|uniref:DUF3857 domain-containing protein n=1 Tax=Sporohalobacter salinus TaxID=1494606 RepID=UPI00195FEC5B|nr:DUF3857 domain-containing protein [Sporohalobacter salinus]MBM7623772.1 hypothetical protein [Sporohalobacter salinus]